MEQTFTKEDLCELGHPATDISDVTMDQIEILGGVRYGCVYWIHQLTASLSGGIESELLGMTQRFLEKHVLYWMEALSLLQSIPQGVVELGELVSVLQVSIPHLSQSWRYRRGR